MSYGKGSKRIFSTFTTHHVVVGTVDLTERASGKLVPKQSHMGIRSYEEKNKTLIAIQLREKNPLAQAIDPGIPHTNSPG